MIREYMVSDLDTINEIGKQIKDNFVEKNNIMNINNDVEKIYVYEQENEVIAFVHISISFEIVDLLNIAVLEKYQKQGIASKLLNKLTTIPGVEKIMLEVRESNEKAINFYQKNNFKVINIRKNYYDGVENALIMEMII